MSIDINKFCATDDIRTQLNAPWHEDGKTVATDGALIVILDGLLDIPEPSAPLTISIKKVDKPLPDSGWVRMDSIDIPAPNLCHCCNGTGLMYADDCDDCGGTGFHTIGNHDYDCQECNANGYVVIGAGIGTERECDVCGGSKTLFQEAPIGCASFQTKYLRMIADLPECEIAVGDELMQAPFRFTGGHGWLMPVRK